MTTLTPEQRAGLKRLCEQATPEPWEISADGSQVIAPCPCCGLVATCEAYGIPSGDDPARDAMEHYNSAFIAAARTALPSLLDEVERLERERDEALAKNSKIVCSYCGEISDKIMPWDRDKYADQILAHLPKCPTHPANKWMAAEEELQRWRGEVEPTDEQLEALERELSCFLAKKPDEKPLREETLRVLDGLRITCPELWCHIRVVGKAAILADEFGERADRAESALRAQQELPDPLSNEYLVRQIAARVRKVLEHPNCRTCRSKLASALAQLPMPPSPAETGEEK